jgi:hypothetical protein
MKVTLRNKQTREFLGEDGKWVPSGLQARNFGFTDHALSHCAELGHPHVHVYYIFDDPAMNFGSSKPCGVA